MGDEAYGARKIQRSYAQAGAGGPVQDSSGDDSGAEGTEGSSDTSDGEDGQQEQDIQLSVANERKLQYRGALGLTGAAGGGSDSEGGSSLDSLDGVPPAAAFAAAEQGHEDDAGMIFMRVSRFSTLSCSLSTSPGQD